MTQPWSPQEQVEPTVKQVPSAWSIQQGRPLYVGLAGVLVLIFLAGLAGFLLGRGNLFPSRVKAASASHSRLSEAYGKCRTEDTDHTLELSDGGATLVIDTRSKYVSTAGMECVLDALSTPQSVKAEIGRTTALMGVQNAEQDSLKYSWSYHPDNGVNMVITEGK